MPFKLIYLAKRNPEVSFADWPRTWRSHAVYVSQFPAVGGVIDKVQYCCRMDESPAGYSVDYDGVAIVASKSADALQASTTAESRRLIDQDELRVFSTLVDNFSLRTEETLASGGGGGNAAIIRFLSGAAGATAEEFVARLAGTHADIVQQVMDGNADFNRYTQNNVIEKPPPGYAFDAITVSWFATKEAAREVVESGRLQPVEEDLAECCAVENCVSLLTRVIHEWPRN